MNFRQKLVLAIASLLILPTFAFAARTDGLWDFVSGVYSPNGSANGADILVKGSSHYLNFGAASGVNGYGIRDNAGIMEFKSSAGTWAAIGTGGSGGTGTVTSVDVSGGTTGLTTSGGPVTTTGTITLAGILSIANGGTGNSTGPFSTTSTDYWQTQRNFFSTTSASFFSSVGLAFSTTSAAYHIGIFDKGFFFSTTSTNYWQTTKSTDNLSEGSTNLYYTAARDIRFSTTSASYFAGLGLAFSTTSSDYWGSTKGYLTSAVTSVTATAPLFSSGGNTPNLTWSGISTSSALNTNEFLQVTAANTVKSAATSTFFNTASAAVSGLLSSSDWTTFNGKENVLTFNAPLFRSANSISWFGLSTTSQPASSNLLVSNGSNGVFGISTSTLTPSSPLTGSFTQLGTGGSLGIQAASASQNGYLASADFSLLHTATTTFSSPLSYSFGTNAVTCPTCNTSNATVSSVGAGTGIGGGTITTTGTHYLLSYLATGTAETKGSLAFWLSTNGTPASLGSVATGTISGSGGITTTANQFIIGSGLTITCTGASGSATGCLSATDYTTFNNKVGTSTSETAGQVAVWGTTNGTPAKLYSVATSTPSASYPLQYSGTLGSFVGGTSGSWSLAFGTTTTNTWSNLQTLTNGFISAASSSFNTINGVTASTTNLTVSGISACSGGSALTTSASGVVSCGAITASGGAWPYTPNTTGFFNQLANSTTTQMHYGGSPISLSASSTAKFDAINVTYSTTTWATTTVEAVTGTLYTPITSAVLLANSGGAVTAATTQTCTNQFLRAMSAAYAATCASVSLTADVSGILPIANGGTATSTGGWTNTLVAYDGSKHTTYQNLFWDGIKFGIGSSTPSALWGNSFGTTTIGGNAQFAWLISSSSANTANINVNWETGNEQRFILQQNTTIAINSTSSNPRDGAKYILDFCQDPTGSRTLTFTTPGQIVWLTPEGTTTIKSTANTMTSIGMTYDGRISRYLIRATSTTADTRACLP